MKKLNFLFVMIALLCISFPNYAQYFGVQGGLNISSMTDPEDLPDPKGGIHLGGAYEYQFSDEFVLQTGLLFSMKGYTWDYEPSSGKATFYYFDIPINAAYKFEVEDVYLLGITGPILGFGLSGKYKSTWKEDGSQETGDFKFESDEYFSRRFDMGWKIGAGVQFMEHFQASLGYTIGLLDVTKGGGITHNIFQISFAYFFEELD